MKILVCPLNWGLGHATRCVPIIRELIAQGHEVVLVADGYPLRFLQGEFPTLRTIKLPSYPVRYSPGKSQIVAMMCTIPGIIIAIVREHFWLKDLLKNEHFDRVISDNRFGMWNKNVHSVYITHQLLVKMPRSLRFLEAFVHFLHLKIISNYNECWIPDNEQNGLSGDLSHKYPLPQNTRFIGILSRFKGMENAKPNPAYEVVAIVSGVEPQRTIFENELVAKYRGKTEKALIIRGQPHNGSKETAENITLLPHLHDYELASYLLGAKKIVSRSGYSTIMDLETLDCLHKAELIPTPGQTEQEYLGLIHN